MKLSDASKATREMLDKHGRTEVEVVINRRLTRTFGQYCWNRITGERMIQLSSKLVQLNTDERVLRTIAHEVAHALTEGQGHNSVWRAKCLELGGDGQTMYTVRDTIVPHVSRSSRMYRLVCDDCGYSGGRYRRRMTGYRHKRCGGNLTSIELT